MVGCGDIKRFNAISLHYLNVNTKKKTRREKSFRLLRCENLHHTANYSNITAGEVMKIIKNTKQKKIFQITLEQYIWRKWSFITKFSFALGFSTAFWKIYVGEPTRLLAIDQNLEGVETLHLLMNHYHGRTKVHWVRPHLRAEMRNLCCEGRL